LEEAFEESKPKDFQPNYNGWVGSKLVAIKMQDPDHYTVMIFGFIPFWTQDTVKYTFNARSEGELNESNHPNYSGELGIIDMTTFRKPIINSRCAVRMSYFAEGPDVKDNPKASGLKATPYKITRVDKKMMYVAAIWQPYGLTARKCTERLTG